MRGFLLGLDEVTFAQAVRQFVLVDRINRFHEIDTLVAWPDEQRNENDELGLPDLSYQLKSVGRMFRRLTDMAGIDDRLGHKRQAGHEAVRVRLESVFLSWN